MNKLDKHPCIKLDVDDFQVEFGIEYLPCDDYIENEIKNIGNQIDRNDEKIEILNKEIERLTNDADSLDYNVAVGSGVIAGLIDSFFVGEWSFEKAKAKSNEEINRKVLDFAKRQGYTGERLSGAVQKLEGKYHLPGDNAWKGINRGISAESHHLDDFSHHPTLVGLIFSIVSQFTKTGIYSNSEGDLITVPLSVDENGKIEGRTTPARIGAGIINWCIDVARNRKGHLYSDMAGSNKTAGGGMGIPGSVLSTLKELSALPGFRDTNFPKKLSKAYKKGIGNGKGQIDLGIFNHLFEGASSKVDLRTENAIMGELKRQSLPIIINEIIVRSLYFIRRLVVELREKGDLDLVDWKKVLPFNNRTIVRMFTISTGTFMMVDLADAAIRGAIKSKGNKVLFAKEFLLRVNFVGIGRFVIAVGTDIGMGIKREKMLNERIKIMSNQLHLMNAKTFYYQANMWKNAISTAETIEEVKEIMQNSYFFTIKTWEENKISLENIGNDIEVIKKKDPKLIKDLLDTLKWH